MIKKLSFNSSDIDSNIPAGCNASDGLIIKFYALEQILINACTIIDMLQQKIEDLETEVNDLQEKI